MKDFHEVHVVVAVFLHLYEQRQLRSPLLTEWQEEGAI